MSGALFLNPGLVWLVAGLVLLVAEVLAPGAFLMWLGMAALGTGVLAAFAGIGFETQVVAFTLLAAASIMVALRLRQTRVPSRLNTPGSGLVGRPAGVLGFSGPEGRVRVGDSDWPARLAPGTPMPATGDALRVVGVDGVVLVVGPAPEA